MRTSSICRADENWRGVTKFHSLLQHHSALECSLVLLLRYTYYKLNWAVRYCWKLTWRWLDSSHVRAPFPSEPTYCNIILLVSASLALVFSYTCYMCILSGSFNRSGKRGKDDSIKKRVRCIMWMTPYRPFVLSILMPLDWDSFIPSSKSRLGYTIE